MRNHNSAATYLTNVNGQVHYLSFGTYGILLTSHGQLNTGYSKCTTGGKYAFQAKVMILKHFGYCPPVKPWKLLSLSFLHDKHLFSHLYA